jgi:hypothetical protein
MSSDLSVTAIFQPKVPDMSVSPVSLDYGGVTIGKKVTKTVKIANHGTGDLTITISGIEGTDFSIKGSTNRTIKPKRSYNLKVTFKPTSTGLKITPLQINSNDIRMPVLDVLLFGVDHTQVVAVGSEGGTVTGVNGIEATIRPGAIKRKIDVAISPVPNDDLKIDNSEGIEVLGAVYFHIGDEVLKINAELAIPNPGNLSGSQIYLGKILHLIDKDLLLMVDTAHVEENSIITEAPAFPGAIVSGTYAFYQNNTVCGVPDYQNYFAGKINPTCEDRLNLHVYLNAVYPQLVAQNNLLYKSINGTLALNDVQNAAINIAGAFLSLNGLNGASVPDLMVHAESGLLKLNQSLYAQIGSTWFDLAVCVVQTYSGDPFACPLAVAQTALKTILDGYAVFDITAKTKQMNENLIAREYLRDYFSYGGNAGLMAQSLGLSPFADMDSIINALAQQTGVTDPWWWPFSSYDNNRIKSIISAAQECVTSLTRSPTGWLSFIRGDPGIPGDGIPVYPDADYMPIPDESEIIYVEWFKLSYPIPATLFKDGFTLGTYFASNPFSNPHFLSFNLTLETPPGGLCGGIGGPLYYDNSFNTFFNNVQGVSFNVSQRNINEGVDAVNYMREEFFPNCWPVTINDVYIASIQFYYLVTELPPSALAIMDAAVILPGQNALP